MNDNSSMASEPNGADFSFVYYDVNDYASLTQRLVAIVVDLVVIGLFGYLSVLLLDAIGLVRFNDESAERLLIASWLPLAFVYLTVLKRSKWRCPGYWVTGLKIVDLKGRSPSMFQMTMRALMLMAGPFHPLMDLLFTSNEPHRQTLRDALLGTYVVRRDAKPAGHGRRVYSTWSIMTMMLVFQEVVPVTVKTTGALK